MQTFSGVFCIMARRSVYSHCSLLVILLFFFGCHPNEQGTRSSYSQAPDSLWNTYQPTKFEFSHQTDTLRQSRHFCLISHQAAQAAEGADNLLTRLENSYQQVANFLRRPLKAPFINYHLYSCSEDKGLLTKNTLQSHYTGEHTNVHSIANHMYADHQSSALHALLLRATLGPPFHPALLEGLAMQFTSHWRKQGYRHWASLLLQTGDHFSLQQIFDKNWYATESRLVRACLAAVLADYLLEYFGREEFLKRYQHWPQLAIDVQALEAGWQNYLETLKANFQPTKNSRSRPPYFKGVNFAHEGYAIYNGYGSRLAVQALGELQKLGSNAIALVPYSYMKYPKRPAPLPFMDQPGTENDESIIHSSWAARKLDMQTMLKPQIWFHNSWPGDVDMQNEADWQQFFTHYYRWIRHYALMAEMYEMDALCVGVEFVQATVQRPDDWRRLIRKLRKIYTGPITYAANWGKEFENLAFGDELDFIGLNCYYPLSQWAEASERELRRGVGQVIKKIEKTYQRFGKKVVLTEVGFRSVKACWQQPHAEAGKRPADFEAQRLCYQLILEGIAGEDWCGGTFWWKWPSYLHLGKRQKRSFSPYRKPAERELQKWFKGEG